MASSKAVAAQIERRPNDAALAVYADEGRGRFIIDLREGTYQEVLAIYRQLYTGVPVVEYFYDAQGREIPVRVFWTNHGYYSQEEFYDFHAAVAYAKSKCFEAAFHVGDTVLAGWSPIGGLRMLHEVA